MVAGTAVRWLCLLHLLALRCRRRTTIATSSATFAAVIIAVAVTIVCSCALALELPAVCNADAVCGLAARRAALLDSAAGTDGQIRENAVQAKRGRCVRWLQMDTASARLTDNTMHL
jgi:hypothetical protein